MSSDYEPTNWPIVQIQTETIPIGWDFDESVDGGTFTLEHSLFGTFSLTGVDNRVEFPITEARSAGALGTYTYTLTVNPGVEGSEQIAARGRWVIKP